jgi:hypothetical protein
LNLTRRRLIATVPLLGLAGCVGLDAPRLVAGPGAGAEGLEPLLEVTATRDGLAVVLASAGCTTRADIAFYVDRRAAVPTVAFARRKIAPCAAPGRVALIFPWKELGLSGHGPVAVLNPVGAGR